ncbi:MAG: ABC transporter substrate-binding protein [Fluviibacter sp.]
MLFKSFTVLCRQFCLFLGAALVLSGCGSEWNDPYPASEKGANRLYSTFSERPKHLDPAVSYSNNEIGFIAQIYEPPLQYHYLKRPYTLIPSTLTEMPEVRLYDKSGRVLPESAPAEQVARTVYRLKLSKDVRYQPHPAFSLNADGSPRYMALDAAQVRAMQSSAGPMVLPDPGSRLLKAQDYVYQIKRLAHPSVQSPIFGMMGEHILGLQSLSEQIRAQMTAQPGAWVDLEMLPLPGAVALDDQTLEITLAGKYPQFIYWLAMNFFAPVAREVDQFYGQPALQRSNVKLDTWPVGTGPYMMVHNNPNARIELERNPNFHEERYPCQGEASDAAAGLLESCGARLPLIDALVFTREKESLPYWNKFLQGYYDDSGISSDSFDQAIRVTVNGDVNVSPAMAEQGIQLQTSVRTSIYYMGFNLLDPVVGGKTPADQQRAKWLRQAISMVLDQEEFISIFLNGRGQPAMGPLPPGIFGYQDGEAGINPVVYTWKNGAPHRRSLDEAKALLVKAKWPDGRDAQTGKPLVLSLDTTSGGLGDKATMDWMSRQLNQLGIQLVVRSTDFNRFQEKLRKGSAQIYFLGWNADYPDPENFFFLLYGPEGKVAHGGENTANYNNPEFNRLFQIMKNLPNGPERQTVINSMLRLVQEDAPWVYWFYPKSYVLRHGWLNNYKLNNVASNTVKYQRIDAARRAELRHEWNEPLRWPILLLLAGVVLLLWPAVRAYRSRADLDAFGQPVRRP